MACQHPWQLGLLVGLLLFAEDYLVMGLEFDMIFQTKCVMEDIAKDVLVLVEYSSFDKEDRKTPVITSVQVEDPKGKLLHDKNDASGIVTFTSKEAGDYKACFTAQDPKMAQRTKIRLDWKVGVAATDWDDIAKKEHLDGLQTQLKKLQETVKEVDDAMVAFRNREEEMRDLNEATHTRVALLSVLSVIICVSLAAWQLWYLKRFFSKKKLI